MNKKSLWSAGIIVSGLVASAATVNPGGVSVDLTRLKSASRADKSQVNLIKAGDFEDPALKLERRGKIWRCSHWVWSSGCRDAAHRQAIGQAMQRSIEKSGGVANSRGLKLWNPQTMAKMLTAEGKPMLNNSAEQRLAVPDSAQAVKYELSFMVKGRNYPTPGLNSLRLFVDFYDKVPGQYPPKALRKGINHAVSLPVNWGRHTLSFIAPAHTRRIDVRFALYGLGVAQIDNVQLTPVKLESEIKPSVLPWSWLDNTFCLGEKLPGTLIFVLQNEAKLKCRNLTLHLEVPAGFQVLAGNSNTRNMKQVKKSDGTTHVSLNIQRVANNIPQDGVSMWLLPGVVIESSLPAQDKKYNLTYYVSNNGKPGSRKMVQLQVIPAVKGGRPANFVSGIMTSHELNVEGQAALRLRDLMFNCGFNALHGGSSKTLRSELKKANFTLFTSHYRLANGYRVGGEKNRTPESYFRLANGKPFFRNTYNTCPVEVYQRGKFYRSEVLPMLKSCIVDEVSDHLMCNWEPYYFDFKGCFCERCREEFVKFMQGKAQPEAIRQAWPRQIIAKYEQPWIRFRSLQHAKVCITLEEDINRLGKSVGKESHFVPEIAWSQLIEAEKHSFAHYSPLDYLDKLPWIEPWGPYIFSDFTADYEYFPGIHLITYCAAQDIKTFLARHVPDPAKRPKIFAFPHGFQCGSWVTEPEALGFEYLCFFVNNWDGAITYYFPRGYDQRYWNALSAANKIIAQNQQLVAHGQDITAQVQVTPRSPLPKSLLPAYWNEGGNFMKRLPALATAALVQYRAFALDGEQVVAVGNFWQRGELFARLQVKKLAPQTRYTVSCSDGYALGTFTGQELQKGILVQVGALRWNFFRISPKKSALPVISPRQMAQIFQQRLPGIRQSYQKEQQYRNQVQNEAAQDNPVNDYKSVYELNQQQLTLKAVQVAGKNYLEIKSPAYRVLLEPDCGGRIASWQLKGQELVNSKLPAGWGTTAFWSPRQVAFTMTKGFKISGMAKVPGGIEVELTRTISRTEKATMQGVKMVKTFTFGAKSIAVKATLTNTAQQPREFVFRFANGPAQLAQVAGQGKFAHGVKFTRDQVLKVVCFEPEIKAIDRAYGVGQVLSAKTADFQVTAPGFPAVKVTFPGKKPHSVAFWDTGHGSTMEPLFPQVNLAPGQSREFALQLNW